MTEDLYRQEAQRRRNQAEQIIGYVDPSGDRSRNWSAAQRQAEPIITGWRDALSILGQAVAFLVILGGIVGGLYLWALAVQP